MSNTHIMSGFLKKLLVAALLIVFAFALAGPTDKALAGVWSPEEECLANGGTFDVAKSTCTYTESNYLGDWDLAVVMWCMPREQFVDVTFLILLPTTIPTYNTIVITYNDQGVSRVSCSYVSSYHPLQNRCKLFDIENPVPVGVNHTIKATFMGPASYLRLNDGEQSYRLPIVPGTQQYAGDNQWTAEFSTADALTGAGLAPAGKYKARCFGPMGTAGGVEKITLTK